ncbi:MAG: putative lipid II flippase FtsW [Deltaproteobacteria bacterium]|uniref:putative lipid II flippase FtsW n=1 Tax=Desulfobacula sp. TaxID=2593537 RepID=UPI0019B1028C|nr:putative lipid II flippase FtsW [Candidatus Desulfobacula maris]MBL6995201.1 putative lipid II flippase FtsW [Desulfobacula sp.]
MAQLTKTIHPFFSEKSILFPVLLLSGIGIVMVYSASSAISMESHNTVFYYMKKQALFLGISLCVMFVAASFPYKLYKNISYIILFTAIAMLVAVLIPTLNIKAGGAHRWLNLGGFTFQPAEFAKLALILFLGYSLSKKQDMVKKFSIGFFPHALIFALFACLIIIQPDFGTIVVLGIITWGMMFVAGVKIFHLLSPTPLLIPIIYYWVYKVDYRLERILSFLNPWDDPYNTGYQITHSLKAFGSGGIFGKGIGLGMQKMLYLPEPHTDFIFSIIGEELGLIGVLTVLSLYLILLLKGIQIAKNSKTLFGAITAAGLTIYIGVQVIINTGVALGALPTKGLTLPFISYGGTSLVINMAAMGILMNIGASKDHEKSA